MRLIDADKLEAYGTTVPKECNAEDYISGVRDVLEHIDSMPTVEAIPIKWLWKHMITHDEVVSGDYYADEAIELNLYISDLIDKWQAERKEE